MSKTGRSNYRRGSRGTSPGERRIIVRGVKRPSPDLGKLSRAVITLALREAEAAAAANDQLGRRAADTKDTGVTSRQSPTEEATHD